MTQLPTNWYTILQELPDAQNGIDSIMVSSLRLCRLIE